MHMLYRRSFEVEKRLNTALRLIRSGRFSAPNLLLNFACRFLRFPVTSPPCVHADMRFGLNEKVTLGHMWFSAEPLSPPTRGAPSFEKRHRPCLTVHTGYSILATPPQARPLTASFR